jgi:hypothetical protein
MRKVQRTVRGGELLKSDTPSRKSVSVAKSADTKGSTTGVSGATIKRVPGACNSGAGINLPDETLQHGLPVAALA